MNNIIKFHITSSILNASIIGTFMVVHGLVIEEFDYLFSIRIPVYFDLLYLISAVIISWIAPFMIHKIKNYKKHFFVLFVFYWILILAFLVFEYFHHLEYTEAYHGVLGYIKHCITKILVREQAILLSVLLPGVIYGIQLLVGRAFISELYGGKAVK